MPDPEVAARMHRYDQQFVERYHVALDVLTQSVLEERTQSRLLVDNDAIEVFKCLKETMKTLSSGIYYESAPQGPVRLSLFRRLKGILDDLLQPDGTMGRDTLKVTEALDILEFLTLVALANTSVRPKSRRYLDWVSERFGSRSEAPQASGIILP